MTAEQLKSYQQLLNNVLTQVCVIIYLYTFVFSENYM